MLYVIYFFIYFRNRSSLFRAKLTPGPTVARCCKWVLEFINSTILDIKWSTKITKKLYPQSVSVSMICLFWGRSLTGFCLSLWGVGVNNHLVKWRVFVGELAKLFVSWMNENGVCFRILFTGLRDFGLFRYDLIIYAFFWNKDCVIILMGLTVGEFLEVHQPLVICWNMKIRRIILWLLELHLTYLCCKRNLYFHCHADIFMKNVLQSGSFWKIIN